MSTPAELLAQSLAKLQSANRVDGSRNSYRKDNPTEYTVVMAYLAGGTRPTAVTSDMGVGLVLEEDARRALLVQPEPVPPDPVPVPPAGLGVDRATMLATGGTVLRSDTSAVADLQTGLWGILMAQTSDPGAPWYTYQTTGGSLHLTADGKPQGNTCYRSLTHLNTDNGWGRTQIGRDWSKDGENAPGQRSGAFALYYEGERKITFLSLRFPSATYSQNQSAWQQIFQIKQAQPYTGCTPPGPSIEVQLYNGRVRIDSMWEEIWSTPGVPADQWIRFALDVTFSVDPAKGRIQLFVDNDGDGDFLDADEMSPVLTAQTLSVSNGGTSPAGSTLWGALGVGIYHNKDVYGDTTMHVDNVQVVG